MSYLNANKHLETQHARKKRTQSVPNATQPYQLTRSNIHNTKQKNYQTASDLRYARYSQEGKEFINRFRVISLQTVRKLNNSLETVIQKLKKVFQFSMESNTKLISLM